MEDASVVRSDLRGETLADVTFYRADLADVRLDRETDIGGQMVYEARVGDVAGREERIATLEAASWTYRELRRLFERDALPRRARAC